MTRDAVAEALSDLERMMEEVQPGVLACWRPGADSAALARAARVFGGELPAELASWFRLHDGQLAGGQIDPIRRWRALPIDEALLQGKELRRDVDDGDLPEDPWLAIATNGNADFALYLPGDGAGVIQTWFHDEPENYGGEPLHEWIAGMRKRWIQLGIEAGRWPGDVTARRLRVTRSPMGWVRCEIHVDARTELVQALGGVASGAAARFVDEGVEYQLVLHPGATPSVKHDDGIVELVVPPDLARSMADDLAAAPRDATLGWPALSDMRLCFVVA